MHLENPFSAHDCWMSPFVRHLFRLPISLSFTSAQFRSFATRNMTEAQPWSNLNFVKGNPITLQECRGKSAVCPCCPCELEIRLVMNLLLPLNVPSLWCSCLACVGGAGVLGHMVPALPNVYPSLDGNGAQVQRQLRIFGRYDGGYFYRYVILHAVFLICTTMLHSLHITSAT